jgi:hypothetical protein
MLHAIHSGGSTWLECSAVQFPSAEERKEKATPASARIPPRRSTEKRGRLHLFTPSRKPRASAAASAAASCPRICLLQLD